jgi:uncharacterized protein (DUF1501 family)
VALHDVGDGYRVHVPPSDVSRLLFVSAFYRHEWVATAGGQMLGTSFEEQYSAAADTVLKGTAQEAFDAVRLMKQADPSRYQPANGAAYPASGFGQALKQISQLAKSDVGLEIAFAETGNWDHHVNEGSTQGLAGDAARRLRRSLAALVTDLGERMSDTVVVTMSEFGRAGPRTATAARTTATATRCS